MFKDSEGFARHIDVSLKDRFLSEKEWDVILGWAPNFGFSPKEAEVAVIRECVKLGAFIEPLEIQNFRCLVEIAAPGKVLDAASEALLKRLVEERYCQTSLEDPGAHVARLYADRLRESDIWDEERLKQRIRERLRAEAKDTGSFGTEAWRKIYLATVQELSPPADAGTDLTDLFQACRRELGIGIAAPTPPPPPPPEVELKPEPPPPIQLLRARSLPPVRATRTEPRESKEPSGDDRPGFFDTFPGLLVISLIVAGLVFGGLMLFKSPSEDPLLPADSPPLNMPRDAAAYIDRAEKASTDQEACGELDRCIDEVSGDTSSCKEARQNRKCIP